MSLVSGGKETTDEVANLTKEEHVKRLRRSRAAAKANITKKIKELTEWKMTCDNLIDARAKVKEFSDVVASFYTAHSNYHDAVDDEYDVIDSEEYLQTEKKRIENFTRTLDDWMTNLEIKLYPKEFEVKSVDSVSQIGKELRRKARSSIASSSSKAGSTISARLTAKARKAALEAEKAGLAKQQALEQERLQLEQRNYELKLNTELAKAKAEERVYSEGIYDEAQETPCKLKDHQAETKPEQTETKREEQYKHYKDFKSTRLGTTTTIRSDAGLGSHIRTQYPAKSMMQTSKAKESDASSEIAEEFLRSVTIKLHNIAY